jgi:hypothetical protein
MAAGSVGIAALLWAYAQVYTPIDVKAGYGLPHYEPVTVPIRLIAAWCALLLPSVSQYWAIALSTTCNAALTILATLFVLSHAMQLHALVACFLLLSNAWCTGLGTVLLLRATQTLPMSPSSITALCVSGVAVVVLMAASCCSQLAPGRLFLYIHESWIRARGSEPLF